MDQAASVGLWRAARRLNQAQPTPPFSLTLGRPRSPARIFSVYTIAYASGTSLTITYSQRGPEALSDLSSSVISGVSQRWRSPWSSRKCAAGSCSTLSHRKSWLPANDARKPAPGSTTQAMCHADGKWSFGESKCADSGVTRVRHIIPLFSNALMA